MLAWIESKVGISVDEPPPPPPPPSPPPPPPPVPPEPPEPPEYESPPPPPPPQATRNAVAATTARRLLAFDCMFPPADARPERVLGHVFPAARARFKATIDGNDHERALPCRPRRRVRVVRRRERARAD